MGIDGSGIDGYWRDPGMLFYRVSDFLKALESNAVSVTRDEKAWVRARVRVKGC